MKIIKQFKIAGTLVMALGIIHILATPVILMQIKALQLGFVLCFAYMFVATGILTMALGWSQWFVLKRLTEHPAFTMLLKTSVVLITIAGVGAVATMWGNPFAYLILFIALYECFLLKSLLNRKAALLNGLQI